MQYTDTETIDRETTDRLMSVATAAAVMVIIVEEELKMHYE